MSTVTDPQAPTVIEELADADSAASGQVGGASAVSATLTRLMRHGGVYSLLDHDRMQERLEPLAEAVAATGSAHSAAEMTSEALTTLTTAMSGFFQHLVPPPQGPPCPVPSSLMSYLTFPHEGVTYSPPVEERQNPAQFESADVPAAFTFVGQFVDHDLTMNAVSLVEPQTGDVPNNASPLIDLDNVYGPRSVLTSPPAEIFDGARFRLELLPGGVIDLPRTQLTPTGPHRATIADARDDENQLLLQVHLLLMRLHNKFVDNGAVFDRARIKTILNWQSVLLHDYLPRITQSAVLADVLASLQSEPFDGLRYRPTQDANGTYVLQMPHEFAIGFRIGHSQLRSAYKLNAFPPVRLFDHTLGDADLGPAGFADLRGQQVLTPEHKIDWSFFLPGVKANAIDTKLASAVFDLPESAIPDDIKFVGNLGQRNLIRSRQINLCSGEDLATFYGAVPLTPSQIEPDLTKQHFFEEGGSFRTPLWYYLLREAKLAAPPQQHPATLGPVGSRLMAEVIAAGIRFAEVSVFTAGDPATWSIRAGQANPEKVTLADLINHL